MKHFNTEFNLLVEKQALFNTLEQITDQLTLLDVDELVSSMEKRAKILDKIHSIDEILKISCAKNHQLKEVLNHECSHTHLSDELKTLYDISLKIKAVVNRISKNDNNIKQHFELQKQQVLGKIEKLNQGSTSTVSKYGKVLGNTSSSPFGKNKFI